jgi:RNA polymerase sigma factor (sigma-70 family)
MGLSILGEWTEGMNIRDGAGPTTSDQALVELTREGDQRAFAELWRRHYRSGARVARQFTSSIDSDDLVSEAYTRIYQRILAGGGPTGAFRPYLYTTIRNLASTWGAASRDVQVDDIADFEDPATLDDPAASALDRTLTARAFRSLPERWQSVLWYTEVEGMDPHEVAPVLGMSANGVAALSYRAREGLRKAWLQAHINDATASGECQWTISRIGEHARKALTTRDTDRLDAHLLTCAKCAIINEEVDEVGSRLAFVMLPILLGGVAGGAMLASYGSAGSPRPQGLSGSSAWPGHPSESWELSRWPWWSLVLRCLSLPQAAMRATRRARPSPRSATLLPVAARDPDRRMTPARALTTPPTSESCRLKQSLTRSTVEWPMASEQCSEVSTRRSRATWTGP